jgi:diketogulonate reductase-like aldo/keto reductase
VAARPVDKATQLLFPDMRRLGFGCGDLFGGQTHAQSVRLLEAALDAGIRYFDVARLYGDGSAEAVLGSVLPRIRDRVIIASKAGIVPWSMLRWPRLRSKATKAVRLAGPLVRALVPPPPPSAARFGAFRRVELERSVNRSLKDLRTDYLDILLLHECSAADARKEEVVGFLERLRLAGKIRTFGIATHFPETCQILTETPSVARVTQFASDALNRNVARLPTGRAELVVTHTPIKQILPRLLDHLAADPAAAVRWTRRTGLAPDDRSGIAQLLLADALAANAPGIVLFSSSRSERITAAAALNPDGDALAALRDELTCVRDD